MEENLKMLIEATRRLMIAAEENDEYHSDTNLQEAVANVEFILRKIEKANP